MLCHGTSRGGNSSINAQTAEYLAATLRQDNEYYARAMASAAFPRLFFLFATLEQPFQNFVADEWKGLPGLADALASNLRSSALRQLVEKAVQRQRAIGDLSIAVSKKLTPKLKGGYKAEAVILHAVLDQKLRTAGKTGWLLSRGGLEDVSADFRLIHDYYSGQHVQETHRWVRQFGQMVLRPDELAQYNTFTWESEQKKLEWLTTKAASRLRQLWYFAVSLARLLQEEDYEFGALDAYWLGLVDEVVGQNLPCLRLMIEAGKNA